jgi:AcrR family transcriptional regulator
LSPKRKPKDSDQSTRQRLLEAAGQVFATKGFEAGTAKEICLVAGTNTAAVNYYFGGINNLYMAVVIEARRRLINHEEMMAILSSKADAWSKLEAAFGLIVRAATGPISASWMIRVIGREFVAPPFSFDEQRRNETVARMNIVRSFVGEIMGLPPDDPAVARGCIFLLAPCWILLLADRSVLKLVLPDLGLEPDDAKLLTDDLIQCAKAGLSSFASRGR